MYLVNGMLVSAQHRAGGEFIGRVISSRSSGSEVCRIEGSGCYAWMRQRPTPDTIIIEELE